MHQEHLIELIKIISTALGEDINLKIKAGTWWSYDFEKNEITFPEEYLLKYSPEQIVGFSIHEAGHRQITRIDLRKEEFQLFNNKYTFKLLFSVFEDARVNNWITSLFPGAKYYLDIMYEELVPEDLNTSQYIESLQKEIKGSTEIHPFILYPHLEYILAVIYYWRFKQLPKIVNPKTGNALKQTLPYFENIFHCLPEKNAGEKERFLTALEAVRLIKVYILEEYKKLLHEATKNISQTFKKNQADSGTGDFNDLFKEPTSFLEKKAQELAEKLLPRIEKPKIQIERDYRIFSSQTSSLEFTLKDFIKENIKREKQSQLRCLYEQFYEQIGNLIQYLSGILENYFVENRRLRYEGYFKCGQKPDLKKVMNLFRKQQEKIPLRKHDMEVFLRRRLPTKREHRIALVLDESGSMAEPKKSAALASLLLFMEALEQINMDYAVIGFSETTIIHKEFGKHLTPVERKEVFEEVSMYIPSGLTADADALALTTELIAEAPQDIVKLIIMITDGEGNINQTGKTFSELQDEAFKKDILVVGIGIGEKVKEVEKRYRFPVLVKEIESLPKILAKVLEEKIVFTYQ